MEIIDSETKYPQLSGKRKRPVGSPFSFFFSRQPNGASRVFLKRASFAIGYMLFAFLEIRGFGLVRGKMQRKEKKKEEN